MTDAIRENADYWENLAPHRHGVSVDYFRAGQSTLSDAELSVLGDVAGKRVLQVAASVGDEAISLAQLGAASIAIDIAPSHVRTGRAKAESLGVSVDFRTADMTALPDDLRALDVIYISWGGLCWVPDLQAWVRDMADRLAQEGRLVIAEHHPLWEVLSVTGRQELSPTRSYFDPSWTGPWDLSKQPQVVAEHNFNPLPHTSYIWNLGQVVTAMIGAGLEITALQEFGDDDMYPQLAASRHLPSIYVASGTRR